MESQDEKTKAAADAEHVAKCHADICCVLWSQLEINTPLASKIIDLIAAGKVPHVRMDYGGAA